MDEKATAAAAFGQRLRELMQQRGQSSGTARSGVDVSALAAGAGTSYEMARRYAEGRALPRPGTLQRIAEWLGVPTGSLAYGPQEGVAAIDSEMLQACIQAVLMAQAETGLILGADRAARLVAMLYAEAMEGREAVPATVARMLRAMA
jgi:transcriptional regulator with XRE-family HTH domain